MKHTFIKHFIFIILLSITAFAQEVTTTNDTVQMQELVVKKSDKKLKYKTVRLRATCYYPETMQDVSEIITLVKNLPKGDIETVTFYFNELYGKTYNEQSGKFKNTEFELMLYTVTPENTPGVKMIADPRIIVIGKEDKGRVKIDISDLKINSPKSIFVGLRRVTGAGKDKEFFVDCLCNGQDKYTTLSRDTDDDTWRPRPVCAALKTDVSVLVRK